MKSDIDNNRELSSFIQFTINLKNTNAKQNEKEASKQNNKEKALDENGKKNKIKTNQSSN